MGNLRCRGELPSPSHECSGTNRELKPGPHVFTVLLRQPSVQSCHLVLAKMKSEIEFLQGAFESYKSTLHQEMNDEFNKKIEKLKSDQEEDTDKQLQQLSKYLLSSALPILDAQSCSVDKWGCLS